MSYEDHQKKLQKLWDNFMSDEEDDPFAAGDSSDEYSPGSSVESDSDCENESPWRKRLKCRLQSQKSIIQDRVETCIAGPSNAAGKL